MKRLFKILAVLLVVLLIGAGVAYFYIDHLVKSGVERGATYALGVDTTVDSASLGITGGRLELAGLHVANPQGYDAPHFMTVQDSALAVTLASLTEDRIEAPELTLSDVDIHLQRRGGKSNYDVIMENLRRLQSDKPRQDGKSYVIREITIDNIAVHVELAPIGGDFTKVDLKIPQVKLNNYGEEEGKGVAMAELTALILKAVLEAAVEKGGGLLPPELAGDLTSALTKLDDIDAFSVEVLGNVEQQLKQKIDEELGEGAGKLLEGVGDILKKKQPADQPAPQE